VGNLLVDICMFNPLGTGGLGASGFWNLDTGHAWYRYYDLNRLMGTVWDWEANRACLRVAGWYLVILISSKILLKHIAQCITS